jgi:hydroxyethylthiazole kinase-like uncharacterized protein yjeF
MYENFDPTSLKKLFGPSKNSSGEENGQVAIIGGSRLFHGAPLFALKIASRICGMVFFTSIDPSVGKVAERLRSELLSFIWVPLNEIDKYVEKSDSILIGPGMMRFTHEQKNLKTNELKNIKNSVDGMETKEITERLITKFSNKKWVIDAGSLQVIKAENLPKGCIITPNYKEFSLLFGISEDKFRNMTIEDRECVVRENAKKHDCIIVSKGVDTLICSAEKSVMVSNGNAGLNKGGMGDVLSGFIASLLVKNDPFLAACSATYIAKKASDDLCDKFGVNYNADDLANRIPETLHELTK